METYKSRLQSQKEALQTDINKMVEQIKELELDLDTARGYKSQAFKELRSIEKKLEKLKV